MQVKGKKSYPKPQNLVEVKHLSPDGCNSPCTADDKFTAHVQAPVTLQDVSALFALDPKVAPQFYPQDERRALALMHNQHEGNL